MKRILLITVRSDEGGGPKHVAQILEHLQGEFEFYTASPYDPPYYEIYSQKSVRHFFLPHRKASLMKAFDLLFWCRDNKIDTVHTHGRGAAFYGFILGAFGQKVIHTFHGVHPKSGLVGFIRKLLERFIYVFNKQHIYVSNSEKSEAHKLGFQSVQCASVIPNGVNVENIQKEYQEKSIEEARAEFNLPNNAKILGTLSRLDPHKQNDKLISAIVKLPEDNQLAIAGDGEQLEDLKKLISKLNLNERVHLIGRIENPIIFLKAIDTYVSWSKGEGHPYSILEAIACNKPILLSNVSGHSDIVDENNMFRTEKEFLKKVTSRLGIIQASGIDSIESIHNIKPLYQTF